MKTTQLTKALILVSIVAGVCAAGCELIVDFDRTKIPVETVDSGGLIDASVLDDSGNQQQDSGDNDGGEEAGNEAGGDDAGDAGSDADADAG